MGIKKSFWKSLLRRAKVALGQAAIEQVSDEILNKIEQSKDDN
jgi:hypothetical protein